MNQLHRPTWLIATALIWGSACTDAQSHDSPRTFEGSSHSAEAFTGTASTLWFDTYAELRGNSGGSGASSVNVALHRGINSTGNGVGAGVFVWTSDTTTPDDGVTVIVPTGTRTGCWKRVFESTYDVQWFGAACDGSTDDSSAFRAALALANQNGGTILIPSGRTCVVQPLNLGAIGSPALVGAGITIRGASRLSAANGSWVLGSPSAFPSTILIQPSEECGATTSSCHVLADNAAMSGGIVMGPNVNHITFEDVAIMAGSRLNDCVINASHSSAGPSNIRFNRAFIRGNGHTSAGIFLGSTAYWSVESSRFIGSKSGIASAPPPDSSSLNNMSFTNNIFYPVDAGVHNDPAIDLLVNTNELHASGNAFEYGLSGIYVAGMRGGDLTSNWFNAEGVPSDIDGTMLKVGCIGCTIANNEFGNGPASGTGVVDGLNVFAGSVGAHVVGNHFNEAFLGTSILINAGGSTIENNVFEHGTRSSQVDVVVGGGVGYKIGPNVHFGTNGWSVSLATGTRGTLFYEGANDLTANKVNDQTLSGSGPGGWSKFSNANLKLASDASNAAHLVIDNLSSVGGGSLNLETSDGRNASLILNDTVAGGAYGHFQINKAGTATVNIAGGSLAGPTYFNAGDNVGIGTASPAADAKLEVNGGIRLNTATSRPSCSAATRGLFWAAQGALGVKDDVQVCAKDASDLYAWRTVY